MTIAVDDDVIFHEWENYHHELTLDAADYEQSQLARSAT